MWQIFLKSRLFAWISAIGSALVMVYVMWTSSRKVQSAEIKSANDIALQKEKNIWNDEKAAQHIKEQGAARDQVEKTLRDAVDIRSAVDARDDSQVREQLSTKWTRKDL